MAYEYHRLRFIVQTAVQLQNPAYRPIHIPPLLIKQSAVQSTQLFIQIDCEIVEMEPGPRIKRLSQGQRGQRTNLFVRARISVYKKYGYAVEVHPARAFRQGALAVRVQRVFSEIRIEFRGNSLEYEMCFGFHNLEIRRRDLPQTGGTQTCMSFRICFLHGRL